jgi:site-specific DNA recombinase
MSLVFEERLVRLQPELKNFNTKYLSDPDIDKNTYLERKQELESQIANLQSKIDGGDIEISNLETYINFSVDVAQNLNKYWASSDLETKRRIQELVFIDGLSFDVNRRAYLTKKVNTVFELIPLLSSNTEGENEKRQQDFLLPSSDVAGVGLEPTIFGL